MTLALAPDFRSQLLWLQVEYTSPARPEWGGLLNLKPGTVSGLQLQVSLKGSRFGQAHVVENAQA